MLTVRVRTHEARVAYKARIDANTTFEHKVWGTWSFRPGITQEDALKRFLSFIAWVAKDSDCHIQPDITASGEGNHVHIHAIIKSTTYLSYRDVHSRWWRNLGLADHKIYDPSKGAAIYNAQPRHQVVVLDDPIVCGSNRCRNRRRGCVMKNRKRKTR